MLVAPGRIGDWAVAGSLRFLRDSPARRSSGLTRWSRTCAFSSRERVSEWATTPPQPVDALVAMLGATEQAVAKRLLQGPAVLDVLVADTELPPAVVSSAVTILLMRGWVQSVGPAYTAAGRARAVTSETSTSVPLPDRTVHRATMSRVIKGVILHLENDLPVMADLEDLPDGDRMSCCGARTCALLDGKRPAFVTTRIVVLFVMPLSRIRSHRDVRPARGVAR